MLTPDVAQVRQNLTLLVDGGAPTPAVSTHYWGATVTHSIVGAALLSSLPREECLRLLASSPVGRVGASIDALPVVLPVNYALLHDNIVFRTAAGTKFHAAAAGAVLAFEADGYEPDGTSGWSVLVQGISRVITDPEELRQVQHLPVEPWALDGAADRVVCRCIAGPDGPTRRPSAMLTESLHPSQEVLSPWRGT